MFTLSLVCDSADRRIGAGIPTWARRCRSCGFSSVLCLWQFDFTRRPIDARPIQRPSGAGARGNRVVLCVVDVLVELHCEVGQDGKLNRNDSRMVIEKILSVKGGEKRSNETLSTFGFWVSQ